MVRIGVMMSVGDEFVKIGLVLDVKVTANNYVRVSVRMKWSDWAGGGCTLGRYLTSPFKLAGASLALTPELIRITVDFQNQCRNP